MSRVATDWAFEQSGLSPHEKLVLLCLSNRHNVKNGCFPGQEVIARDVGLSLPTINRLLLSLERKGLITRERRRSTFTGEIISTLYHLNFPNHASDSASTVSQGDGSPSITSETRPYRRTRKTTGKPHPGNARSTREEQFEAKRLAVYQETYVSVSKRNDPKLFAACERILGRQVPVGNRETWDFKIEVVQQARELT